MNEKINLTDPDAAEKAARIYMLHVGGDGIGLPPHSLRLRAMRAVLDAIEIEQPRLPTRSEIMAKFTHDGSLDLSVPLSYSARNIANAFVGLGWATEDPEPEVDPPVDELDVSFLRDLLAKIDGRAAQNQALGYSDYARWLLQSGAITVSRELRVR